MSWIFILLPAYVSLLFLAGGFLWTYWLSNMPEIKNVPRVEKKVPDIGAIGEKLAGLFPVEVNTDSGSKETPNLSRRADIKLKGVILGSVKRAVVEINGNPLIMSEGEEKKGVKLSKLWRNKAKFTVNGEDKLVYLSVPEVKSSSIKAPLPPPPPPPGEVSLSRKEILRVTKDPGIMFREIRLVPYVRSGRTEGFIFEWIKPGSLFDRVGLRKGDVLVSINNMDIKSGEDAFRILQTLRNSDSLRVVVKRQGRRKTFNIRID